MSQLRLSLSFLALVLAAPALARPVPVDDLAALAANVDADVLVRLAERRGLDRPLGPADREALTDAGVSAETIDRLALLSEPPVEVDGVGYSTVDGVLRVRGEGSEADESVDSQRFESAAHESEFESFDQADSSDWRGPETSELPVTEPLPEPAPLEWGNPYPVGVFGGNIGAVFLPARFGERPSAFGRTIVSTAPVVAAPWWGLSPTVGAFDVRPLGGGAASHPPGFIPFRTSRGTLWVPN